MRSKIDAHGHHPSPADRGVAGRYHGVCGELLICVENPPTTRSLTSPEHAALVREA